MVLCTETETLESSLVLGVNIQVRSIPEDYASSINYYERVNLSKKINCLLLEQLYFSHYSLFPTISPHAFFIILLHKIPLVVLKQINC